MIIVEVDCEFQRFDVLLGMHSWSKFLLAPTAEEAGNSSEVFFCSYNTNKAIKDWWVALMEVVPLIVITLYRMESCRYRGALVPRMASRE
jgi:hypothetical protein